MTKQIGQPKPSLRAMEEDDASDNFLHMMSLGEDFLEHHGVKGMKWGVRKAAGSWRDNKQASLERTGNRTGSKVDYARSVSTSSVISLARNKGTRGAARTQAANIKARQARLNDGSASKADKVLKYKSSPALGGYSSGGKNKDTRFTAEKDKLSVNKSDHAVTKQVKKDHNTLSDGHFQRKYGTSKSNYRKRVAKHGDPYRAALNGK